MANDNPIKAYTVRDNDEGHSVIVFATNGATARREGGNELKLLFEEVESCKRAPWADQYAPGPVPLHAYLDNGWWFECQHCGVRFDDEGRHGEGDDDRDDDFEPVEDGEAHYCSPACKMADWAEKRERSAHICAAIEAASTIWPMATRIDADKYSNGSGGYEYRAQFTLPGIRYPAHWVPGAKTVSVSQCDVEDFERLYGVQGAE